MWWVARIYKDAMPSPFPGMDPTSKARNGAVCMCAECGMARQLAPKVRPKYIVRTARTLCH